ncbi:hypothetical protein POM88_034500 [Heracleum sosnowskyi]|uniref:Uncharacterized protein n=1 Tax=Heracleum sosnowskyi TaxID=360622 RepID=A0AAD8HKF8_9APIA|nr:hypothetical protein POM88_034500 [Heracleum sosnowskyi]
MSDTDDDTYEAGPLDDSVLSFQSEHRPCIWAGEDIPSMSPHPGHDIAHDYGDYADSGDWDSRRDYHIQLWKNWGDDAISPPLYALARNNERVHGYDEWFQSITRRFIVDVRRWREQDGFQGSKSFHGGGSSSRRGRPKARPVMPESGTYLELA